MQWSSLPYLETVLLVSEGQDPDEARRFKAAAKELGARVRQLRKRRGLTLQAAAERSNIDLSHLQKIEGGLLNVTLLSLIRIAHGLDVALPDLFQTSVLPEAERVVLSAAEAVTLYGLLKERIREARKTGTPDSKSSPRKPPKRSSGR